MAPRTAKPNLSMSEQVTIVELLLDGWLIEDIAVEVRRSKGSINTVSKRYLTYEPKYVLKESATEMKRFLAARRKAQERAENGKVPTYLPKD